MKQFGFIIIIFLIFDAYISGLPLLVVGLWSFLTYYLPDPYLQPPSASAIPYSMDDSYYKKDDGTTGPWNSSTENIELVSNSYTAEQGKQNSLGRNVMLFIPIHIVRNSIWKEKNQTNDNIGKFHTYLKYRIWIHHQKSIS